MIRTIFTVVPSLRGLIVLLLVVSMFAPSLVGTQNANAISPNLVIAQVYGGGGAANAPYTHDFVVLFNRGDTPVSLSGMSVQYASATGTGSFGGNPVVLLTNTMLAPGQYYLIQLASGTIGAALPSPDVTGSVNLSASSGKVALVNSPVGLPCNGGSMPCSADQLALILDLVGYGSANFSEGAPAPGASAATAATRLGSGCTDTDNNSADFQPLAPDPRNTASPFSPCGGGDTAPNVTETTPGTGAVNVPLNTNLSITFSEPVTTAGNWFSIQCATSGEHAAAQSGGPVTFTLEPAADFVEGETCVVTVSAAQITDQDAYDPPDAMWVDYRWAFTTTAARTLIHTIQGAGHRSPLENRMVSDVSGIVTARTNRGFYLQDPNPDANPATSEAIFVYTASAPAIQVGDRVAVDGKVEEYRSDDDANLTVTEITAPTVRVLSSGNPLPPAVIIGAGGRVPPNAIIEDDAAGDVEVNGLFDPENDGLDFYESLEAMRVQLNDAVVVGPKNSYGEVPVIGDSGANAGLRTPRGGLIIRPGDFNPERITLDDEVLRALGPAQSMPELVVGDRLPGALVGVVDYSYGLFKLQAAQAPAVNAGGLAREVAQSGGGTRLAVASVNTENLSAVNDQERFDTLAGLIIHNLRSPDVLALEEIQDNNGSKNDGIVDANETLNRLINAVQRLGGPEYRYRQINPVDDQDGGQPGGNIRVVFLYRTDRGLSFVDRPGAMPESGNGVVSDATGVHLLYSPGRVDPTNAAFAESRKPLAGEFLYNGQRIFVIANHFNSKGGDQPLFGRFQPPVLTTEAQRVQQAQVVHNFVSSILDLDPRANVIVLGDLNDFQFSAPLNALKGSPPILTALIERLPEAERYTYVYEGNSQALDHILVSSALAERPLAYDSVHINSEFVDQASDHDPQLLIVSLPVQEIYLPAVLR